LQQLGGEGSILEGKNVTLHRKRESSKSLNKLKGPAIILSSSGMLTGGRILHHMINRLPDPKTLVVLVGFMAEGTLGRKLVEGADMVYIHKTPVKVNAKIVTIEALSGHADWYEILHWLKPMPHAPQKVFVTHGEPAQSIEMADHIKNEYGWETMIPMLDQTVVL
jgi:metallo-beta-lactamase family protein